MQCKDINDAPILEFLGRLDCWGTWFKYDDGTIPENSVLHAMPEATPPKLALAKMKTLMHRGLVDGCGCGCRGDFVLNQKGREFLEGE